jgi:transcriptional regulator with XRE-family HTH domain
MNFGPKDAHEAPIFAEEGLRVEVQHRLQTVMNQLGVTQSDLAARMGVSEAHVSQLFSSTMNATIRKIAAVFHALGDECIVTSKLLERSGSSWKESDCECAWTLVEPAEKPAWGPAVHSPKRGSGTYNAISLESLLSQPLGKEGRAA